MEQIIRNLLGGDTATIAQAQAELQEAYKRPETIPVLCDIAISHPETNVRQFASVLLRRRLAKLRNWQLVPPDHQTIIKNGMLRAMATESQKTVRMAQAHFVGILIKHEFAKPNDPWTTELLTFIYSHCSSSDSHQSEVGSSIFAVLADIAPDQFVPYMEDICKMFSAALLATEASGNMSTNVIYNILTGMAHLVPVSLGHNAAETTYQKSIPYIIKALQGFAIHNPDQFPAAFDVLENMADYMPHLLSSNLKLLLDFCMEVSSNNQLQDAPRIRTVSFIGWLVRLKKTAILKQKLLEPIVRVVFNLMAYGSNGENDDDEDEEYFVDAENSSPRTTATQTMDLLALHVPPEKLMPQLLILIEPALKSDDPLLKRAAYLSMAVVAEGCSESICTKYLRSFLDCIKVGIVDANVVVRNAALFALGQFSEYLQPEVTKFAGEILPILLQFLHQLCNEIRTGTSEPKNIDRMFYALETYCENLGEEDIVPHLPIIMERLFEALSPNNSVHLRELALSAVSSTASAAKENMMPYFEQIIAGLQMYLVQSDNEDICTLRPQAIDTLATLCRTIGKDNFAPLINETMTFGLISLESASEPELRTSLYNLFASLAEVIGDAIEPALPKIVERMLETIKSSEEMIPEYKSRADVSGGGDGPNENVNTVEEDIDIENSEGSDDESENEFGGFSVENAFMDEKEEAVLALKQIAEYTSTAFISYIEKCYEAIYKLLDHPQEDIRKIAVEALTQFVISLHKVNNLQAVHNVIHVLVPKFAELVKSDEECIVAMTVMECFGQLLIELKKQAVVTEALKTKIFECIQIVLSSKAACQFSESQVNDDEQDESEYDETLVDMASDVLPKLGEAMEPQEFAMYFGRVLPMLLQKIEKNRDNTESSMIRSSAYGTMSECFKPLQSYTGTWFDSLFPIYLRGVVDTCEQVRQNTIFGLGELVLHSEEKSYAMFPMILQALSAAVSSEKHAGTLDNICGALARMIITNYNLIPLQQVLPVFVQQLPLREDFDENLSIFKSFIVLFTQGSDALVEVLDRIILIGLHILYKKQYKDDETRECVLKFLTDVRAQFTEKFNAVATSDPEIANFVQSL